MIQKGIKSVCQCMHPCTLVHLVAGLSLIIHLSWFVVQVLFVFCDIFYEVLLVCCLCEEAKNILKFLFLGDQSCL